MQASHDTYKGTNPIHEGFIHMTSSNPNYLSKALPPNTIHHMVGDRGHGFNI